MDHYLILLVVVLIIMVAIATGLLITLAYRLRSPKQEPRDPLLERLSLLAKETAQRQTETNRRLVALRETLNRGLKNE